MDAIGMLEKDHEGAKKVMEEISRSFGAKKKKIFEDLKRELEMHDHIEESIFYPSVQSNPKTSGFPAADKKAHEAVEKALDQLSKLSVEDSKWSPMFKSMQENLMKHIADEETNLFVKIRDVLSATELNTLGDKMKAEKEMQVKAV